MAERKKINLTALTVGDGGTAGPSSEMVFETLKVTSKTVVIDGQTFYLKEGDLLLDEDELYNYALEQTAYNTQVLLGSREVTGLSEGLVGMAQEGKIVRWKQGLKLTYCVLKKSFPDQQNYDLVCRNMERATRDWENTCSVKFEHVQKLDDSAVGTKPAEVVFVVREVDAAGKYIALAFFPSHPPDRRRILVDPSYYSPTLGFDQVGVFRHELGHVLGFRHEHIRSNAPAICQDEDTTGSFDLTQYDPSSVMHYFCGGMGTRDLSITMLDRVGAQSVYGKPDSAFAFFD